MLLCLLLTFCLPVTPAAARPSESSEEIERIKISISIFENIGHSYLAGPLTLQCPTDATPAEVLEILCDYAYLDDVTVEDELPVAIAVNDETYTAVDGDSGWILTVNGQQWSELSDEERILEDNASLEWIYWVTDEAQDVIVSGEYAAHGSTAIHQSLWQNEYNESLNQACTWLKTSSRNASSLFALGSAGVSVEHKYLTAVLKEIALEETADDDGSALARDILAVSFSGISAENVSERNLIAELADFPDVSRQAAALALLAADCNGYDLPEGSTNDRSALLNVILAAQNEDGSFSPIRGETGTVTATALSLTALAPYNAEQSVLQAIDKGILWLSEQRDPVTGGYLDEGGALSCQTTAVVITALTSLGIQLDDPQFCDEGGTNLLQLILTLQQEGGGFAAAPGGEVDIDVTQTAILAMVAQKSCRSPYLLRSPIVGEGSPAIVTNLESKPESSEESVVETDTEPVSKLSILFGAVGLAIGILLGSVALLMAVKLMKKADKIDAE